MVEMTYYCDKCNSKIEGKIVKVYMSDVTNKHLCGNCENDFLMWLGGRKKPGPKPKKPGKFCYQEETGAKTKEKRAGKC